MAESPESQPGEPEKWVVAEAGGGWGVGTGSRKRGVTLAGAPAVLSGGATLIAAGSHSGLQSFPERSLREKGVEIHFYFHLLQLPLDDEKVEKCQATPGIGRFHAHRGSAWLLLLEARARVSQDKQERRPLLWAQSTDVTVWAEPHPEGVSPGGCPPTGLRPLGRASHRVQRGHPTQRGGGRRVTTGPGLPVS